MADNDWYRELFGDQPTAREQHYSFCHRVLPDYVFSEPTFVEVLRGDTANDFLRELWEDAGAGLPGAETEHDATPTISWYGITPEQAVGVVTVPEALYPLEAKYVAIVVSTTLRVLTLERGSMDEYGEVAWILGEWTADNGRRAREWKMASSPDDFVATLSPLLR